MSKMRSIKEITPSDYAKVSGRQLNSITRSLRAGVALDGVIEVKKFGRFYVLVVSAANHQGITRGSPG